VSRLLSIGVLVCNLKLSLPTSKLIFSKVGCSDPYNVHRADVSIRVATALDVFADLLSMLTLFSSHEAFYRTRNWKGLTYHFHIVMLLPLRLVWTLRISVTQKLALACLFSLGMVVVIFAFVRLYNITKATPEGAVDLTKLAEAPLTLSLWSQIEAAVSVIVANLPALRSFLRRQLGGSKYGPKGKGSSGGSSSATSKKIYQVYYTGKVDPTSKSKSAIRHQSVELASLDGNEDVEWPITGKAAAMLGVADRTMTMKSTETGDTGILTTTEVKVTRGPRTDQHRREDSLGSNFGLQLRPDLN
jgi:hypothetical protein